MDRRIVMACGDNTELHQLKQMLAHLGYRVIAKATNGMDALKAVRSTSPEVVMLDDYLPVLDGMQVAKIISEENLAPAVLMISQGNKGLVERAGDVTSAFLMRPYLEDQVYAAIEAAVSSHKRYTQLQQQLYELQDTLKTRKIMERAKGILMKQRGYSEEQAHRAIQHTAMEKRTSVKAVAEAIVITHQMKD